jgi:uncharacterized protein YndB with AHSA1/START domain
MTTELPYELERTVRISASPDVVFGYFTDSSRWAAWWGTGSTIEPTAGGSLLIRYPNAVEAVGNVEEIDPPRRIVFTMGYPSGKPFPPGGSRVTITLEDEAGTTLLHLTHATVDPAARDLFVQGWRYQLSLFANVVLDSAYADAAARVDEWFAALSQPDDAARSACVSALASPAIEYRDRYSCVDGVAELLPQVAAMHRFMPGFTLTRRGDVRHRQGSVLVDWAQARAAGTPAAEGTSVIEFAADGRVARVTTFGG